MPSITIRPATDADIPQLAQLWHEKTLLQLQSDRRFVLMPDGQLRWMEHVRLSLASEMAIIFVAERDGQTVGYLIVCVQENLPGLLPEKVGAVTDMAIGAHTASGGVGRLLLDSACEWLAAQGIRQMIAWVPHRQVVDQAFWRAQHATEWMDVLWMKW